MKWIIGFILIISMVFVSAGCSVNVVNTDVYTGTIEADSVYIQSEITGRVTKLFINKGDSVKKGDRVAQLDVSQYEVQAKAAKTALDIATIKYDNMKKLNNSEKDIAKLNVDQAQSAYDLANLMVQKGDITSPIDGTVTDVFLNEGEITAPGGNIAEITNLKNLWVKIYVPEKYLYKVSLNKIISLNVSSISGKINGKVIYISSKGEFTPKNTVTKSSKQDIVYEVKIKIIDHLDKLKPGMLIDAHVE